LSSDPEQTGERQTDSLNAGSMADPERLDVRTSEASFAVDQSFLELASSLRPAISWAMCAIWDQCYDYI
jgi:hypothetical protein